MPQFYARVELHKGKSEDYERLHSYMKLEQFSECIGLRSGVNRKMPEGFYVANLIDQDVSVVAKTVIRAADKTKLKNEIVVIKSAAATTRLSKECE
jgi:hypothetical protein